ncbi:MAG: ADP-ribosylglycohydrolase family protein [Candidatus Pacearchaeota archaeon]
MLGAVLGDIAGSLYEWKKQSSKDFDLVGENCFYTDDTVLTIATADAVLNNLDFGEMYMEYANIYPYNSYGVRFTNWYLRKDLKPYNSFGNGSAMRISPVGYGFDALDLTLEKAKNSAEVTHNHPEGIKGAQAVASSIFLARTGKSKDEIKSFIENKFNYDLSRTLAEIRPVYNFDETCQGSVPEAIIAFLESKDYEDALKNAITLGGDADTQACIAGGIAEAYYKNIPEKLLPLAKKLEKPFIEVLLNFYETHNLVDEFPYVKYLYNLLENQDYRQD